ncbi:type 1 glutamine amidotransferase domain-containing protein [Pseudoalteromonas shioyasakiensis]|jgi:putative intracellular protease/amidase|uniref:Type 1 glutamine amidotransferase domain-containing protein n=1 Tax=Pseudoalteromonas shioyasakiensis TaxID=1190813 RepID=A0ABT6U1K0_9GAMM|nr:MULTISPECIES: type 1 glutamine amidotransferase domain-containing protein [Pseudoalteromonas]KZY42613.1 dimethylallyltransferase [Pseudoalteromonas shioyasakiensis]MCO7205961.1 type 1 glutamine amidotransferase domain-containing protein [Pseudoalteromonas sp. CnMc7-37]MDI4651240.1 type 1 glutamine amidotransferase domain-containing protein [Pseudoalteromonas shioyasakiensis]MDI4670044.1 type 1 glutamine amidotransferase domain-containing protein [Pseudoalteromonas shioyasakiensis]MDI4675235|tara:strand:- start:64 stop:750 length:687 start_codon:yes stop_codon:yes gene_type:complete
MSAKKILMVLTSHDELGDTGHKTGFWVEEFAAPYYAFIDAGAEVTLASVKGGQPPVDPNSAAPDAATDATKRFEQDSAAKTLMANTKPLAEVKADDFDAVFYPGGHGPLWDLVDNQDSISLIEQFLNSEKPVGAVCHASAVLLNAKNAAGKSVVFDKKVTGFSNSEEDAVQLTNVVPLLVEDELIKQGGQYQKTDDWGELAIEDGLLITGQNPASSELAAKKLLTKLG